MDRRKQAALVFPDFVFGTPIPPTPPSYITWNDPRRSTNGAWTESALTASGSNGITTSTGNKTVRLPTPPIGSRVRAILAVPVGHSNVVFRTATNSALTGTVNDIARTGADTTQMVIDFVVTAAHGPFMGVITNQHPRQWTVSEFRVYYTGP